MSRMGTPSGKALQRMHHFIDAEMTRARNNPSKAELREDLAEAVRNTAKLQMTAAEDASGKRSRADMTGQDTKKKTAKVWTAAEHARLEKLIGMVTPGKGSQITIRQWRVIAAHFPDRTLKAIRSRGDDIRRLQLVASAGAPRERDCLAYAERHSSLTAAAFGDPPPGRSALDRKRAACAS